MLQSDTRRLKHASTLFKAIQEAFVQFEQELTKIQVNIHTHTHAHTLHVKLNGLFTIIEIRRIKQ